MSVKEKISKLGSFLDASGVFLKRTAIFAILLFISLSIIGGLFPSDDDPIKEGGILNLNIKGALVEELSQSDFERAFSQFSGESQTETLITDVIQVIRHAKDNEDISTLLISTDDFSGGSTTKLELIAKEITEFKTSGKKVIAYSDQGYGTAQYYLAAYADEIHLHDYTAVFIDGYRRVRTYYKSFFDKFLIDANVFKVGEYKAFVEPYFRDDMSDEAKGNVIEWITVLWDGYLDEVSEARGISNESLKYFIDNPGLAAKESDGDFAKAAIEYGLIDQLSNRREFRDYLYSIAPGEEEDEINIVGMNTYMNSVEMEPIFEESESNVGVIIAKGSIVDGSAGPGSIAGDDFVKIIRKAYEDETVKALVLRVDSGGGSAYASEVIADELEKFKDSGRPIIASMGGVAASGGYYISTPADKILAERHTITGSIGVGGFLPTFERALEYIGINEDGVSTVDITTSVAESLTEKDKALLQMGTDLVYDKFIAKVADNRGVTKEEIDQIARGKVWIGSKALEIGLVDEIAGIDRAIELAAELAEIDEELLGVKRINRDSDLDSFFAGMMAKITSSIIKITGLDFLYKKNELLDGIEESLHELSMMNDPNGIYMKCFCELD
ncbi:MAG: signal peptide peptidase SppA [Gammaproteobacteria bacterium]|nr:signal peptide peptidase SppA [Gammaproteobacteria bacterium]OUT92732.1 MAG: signal peptide peptidase SppA [Gammaproteobacteria bacterium TMED36]